MSSNYRGELLGDAEMGRPRADSESLHASKDMEPIGHSWPDDEGECSICLETLTDCTCLDNLKPSDP